VEGGAGGEEAEAINELSYEDECQEILDYN
jgi:hypothetical protein